MSEKYRQSLKKATSPESGEKASIQYQPRVFGLRRLA
jgi:hypothetical protein